MKGENFLKGLDEEWDKLRKPENDDVRNAMVEELRAFVRALERGNAVEKENLDAPKTWRSEMLGWGSSTVGSLKDMLDQAPWYVKHGFTLFEELIGIVRGKA